VESRALDLDDIQRTSIFLSALQKANPGFDSIEIINLLFKITLEIHHAKSFVSPKCIRKDIGVVDSEP
jgi:hypothetical protein